MGYVGLKIKYILAGERDIVANWRSIIVDVGEQDLRQYGSNRYGYKWATRRVQEHHGDPELGCHVFGIDRDG